jgi:hypothetical protein
VGGDLVTGWEILAAALAVIGLAAHVVVQRKLRKARRGGRPS